MSNKGFLFCSPLEKIKSLQMIQTKNVSHVVFIDSNVEDYQSLISGVSPNAEVIILDETRNGIEQITERLATKQNIEAIHIISHGSPGSVQLGANTLNSSNIESFAPGLKQWRKALTKGADILLYGCNVAADVSVTTDIDYIGHISQGLTPLSDSLSRLKATQENLDNSLIGSSVDDFRYHRGVKTPGGSGVKPTQPNQFLQRLSELTGADIAASANPTGNGALGGDWELEVQIGRIEATPIQALGYSHILATATPDNKAISVNSPQITIDTLANDTGSSRLSVQSITTAPANGTATINDWIYAGGFFTTVNGTARNYIARMNADGSLDTAFNPTGGMDGSVRALALDSSGKLYAGGYFLTVNGTARNNIARMNADGSLDTAFNPPGGMNDGVSAIALDSSGKLYAGGAFTKVNGTARNFIARMNADGSLDTAFNPTGGMNLNVSAIALDSSGKLYAGGLFTTVNGTARNYIARMNADGSLDTAFNPSSGMNNNVAAIALDSSGKPYAGGNFTTVNGTARNRIARMNADGSLDNAFNPTSGMNTGLSALALDSSGKLYAGGAFTKVNGTARNRIARMNADGSLDTAFNPSSGMNNYVLAIAVDKGRNIFYTPNTGFNGVDTFQYTATDGVVSTPTTVSVLVNDSPALDISGSPTLNPQNQDDSASTGTLISTLIANLGGTKITDRNLSAKQGIAITNLDTTNGTWQYTTGSTTWNNAPAVSATNALLLASDTNTRLRFVPNPGYNGTLTNAITFAAWDQITGTNGDVANYTTDRTNNTTSSVFSSATETANIAINPSTTVTSVTATTPDGTYGIGKSIDITVNFSQIVNVTGTPQLSLAGVTPFASYFSGTGSNRLTFRYAVAAGDFSPDLDYVSPTALSLSGGTITDGTNRNAILTLPTPGAPNSLGASKAIVIDGIAPTVALTSASPTIVNAPFSVTATFLENVTGFDNTDITVTNATVGNFVQLDAKTYSFDVIPSADGNVTVDVLAAKATDTTGNNNTAATGLTRTADITAPAVTLTSASATTVNAAFSVTATFTENVTGFDNTDITVTNATVGNFVQLDPKTYSFDVTPSADGNVTVDVLAATATDTAGNNNTATTGLTRTADITAPSVTLTSVSATTVNAPFSVTATFSKDVTGFDNTDITVTNATVGNFVQLDPKTYTFDVTPSADGNVTVDVLAATATDTAGNNNTAATGLTRTADITAPTVTLTSASPTVNGLFSITATFSEDVTGFDNTDITVTNATVGNFVTLDAKTYTFDVTPSADGNVTVDVFAALATDTATNNNTAATQLVRTADITAPTVALTSTSPTTINAPFLVTATFSENVTEFIPSDINVTNGTVSGFTGSGTTYNFTVTPNADGPVTVDVPEAIATDNASNNNTAATPLTRTADVTASTASLDAVSNITDSGGTSQTLTVTFSDSNGIDVSSLDNSDIVVNWSGGAIPARFVGVDTNSNSTTRTVTYLLTPPGGSWDDIDNDSYTVNLQASQVKDTLGNQFVGSNLGSFTVNIPTPTPPPPPTPTPPPPPTPTPTLGTPAVIFLEPLGTTEVFETLGSDIYKVRLNTQPTANVTVDITPGTQVTVSLPALTFTPANWDVAQTITVTAVDDAVVEGNHLSPISHTTTSTDTLYNNLVAPLTVNISDNDNLGDVQTLLQKSVIGFTQKDDRVTGSPLNDMIHARPGNDYLDGKAGNDLLYGQKGDDGIRGGDGDDIIFGGEGIDFINGDRGFDFIYGGKGNDRIYSGDGDDIVFADGGNDYLFGEMGADTLTGGLGFDVFALAIGTGSTGASTADVITDFNLNQDKIDLISPLAFNQLNIFQGTGAFASDTIIQYQVTGEYLAILKGVTASSIVPVVIF